MFLRSSSRRLVRRLGRPDRRTSVLVVMALVVGALAAGPPEPARAAVTVPAGFIEGTVADVFAPTDLAFLPDGRMLVSSKPGVLRMIKNDVVLPTPVVDLSAKVCSRREEGLAGVAVDPAYSTNHFVYLFYTFNRVGTCYTYDDGAIVLSKWPVNRLSRFVLPAGSDVIDPASEFVLLDNMPALGMHNAGDIDFGADGLLYVSVGDAGCRVTDQTKCQASNDNARSLALPLGKILRITRNGTVPADNPYASVAGARRCTNPAGVPPGSGPCSEIFATGLRNPFRFSFKPGTNTFHINDVGLALWEEIDLGAKGADYGWNVREGHCATRSTSDCGTPPAGMTNPIYDYAHSSGCKAITASAWVPEGLWGHYAGSYLYADYVCGKIFRLVPGSGGKYTTETVVSGLGVNSAVSMQFGPYEGTQALYYTTYTGQVRRLAKHIPVPVASFTTSPTRISSAPATVHFDASDSTSPLNTPLRYHWDFGDGQTLVTSGPTVDHVYGAEGGYTATLRVSDGSRESQPATRTVTVGDPPTATILSPSADPTYSSHDALRLRGAGVDGDGVALPGSALSWQVLLHHEAHIHPYFGPASGDDVAITYPSPEDLGAAATSYVEVQLTVTAPNGIKTTVTRNLLPKKVSLTFKTDRSTPLALHVADQTLKGAATVTAWANMEFTVHAPSPQSYPDRTYYFRSWSDGKPQTHQIVAPAANQTYTASFDRVNGPPPPPPPPLPPPPSNVDFVRSPTAQGYWMVSTDGTVRAFGDAPFKGSASTQAGRPAVGMARTVSGQGYWVTAVDGAISSFGDGQFYGSTGNIALNKPIVGMAATPSGRGYWLVATDGGIFSFGDAAFYGSTGAMVLNKPIVGMAATPSGRGYWLVASDGGIFSFGDAAFYGSTGAMVLNKPIVGMATAPEGGYWLVASDGGIFAFTDGFYGSLGGHPPASPVTAIESTGGAGYWMITANGQVFHFGDAGDYGSV